VSVATATEFEWREFRCEVVPERETVRVRLVGELDLATADEVAAAVEETRGFGRLVVDLSEVTFLDSSGIRAILQAQQTADRDGMAFAVVPGPRAVQRAFTLAGVADLLFPPDHGIGR
jgi:anti-sigma B factor antagonist